MGQVNCFRDHDANAETTTFISDIFPLVSVENSILAVMCVRMGYGGPHCLDQKNAFLSYTLDPSFGLFLRHSVSPR
jgi:hypothetical protein